MQINFNYLKTFFFQIRNVKKCKCFIEFIILKPFESIVFRQDIFHQGVGYGISAKSTTSPPKAEDDAAETTAYITV